MVTREQFSNYKYLADSLKVLDFSIEEAYNTYHSPSFEKHAARSKDSSSPVERSLQYIESLKEERKQIREEMEVYERYVANIKDPYIRSLCRYHYLQGKSWKETGLMFRSASHNALSDKLTKYFQSPEAIHD